MMRKTNVGDDVYLIYVGWVTVLATDSEGNIEFKLYDDEKINVASRSQYRTKEHTDVVRHHTIRTDYTRKGI